MPKKSQTRYGIEITKPHSKEMYTHNDEIAYEMKAILRSEITEAHMRAIGTLAASGGMDKGEKDLRKIGTAIEGSGYGDGYELAEIKDNILNTLTNIENWQLHQEYGYLRSEGIVPWIEMKMLGFDKATDGCWDCYWEEENPSDEFRSPAAEPREFLKVINDIDISDIIADIDGAEIRFIRTLDTSIPYIKTRTKHVAEEVVHQLLAHDINSEIELYEDDDGDGDGGRPIIRKIYSVKLK